MDDLKTLAQNIQDGLKANAARNSTAIVKPEILNQPAPKELTLTYIEERREAESSYVSALLNKSMLTPEETKYLAGSISRFLKTSE
jgi:hypothetical protein